MNDVFLQSADVLGRSLILVVGSYVGLIFILRLSGKRTLSKMNAFDLVVTVALGSTLATISLSKDTALILGLLVLVMLILLQYVVAWLSVRSERFQQLVKATPQLLFHEGEFLEPALRSERVSREEIFAAIRAQGVADLRHVAAVVLETDGTFSVLKKTEEVSRTTLEHVAAS
jgi:uncharacterized membrane protein YcaP (DUF421 family)